MVDLSRVLQRYQVRVEKLSKEISRDAFIVSQMVQATRELQDFQITVAVEKVHDRIKDTRKRALQEPIASPMVQHTLRGLDDMFEHAKRQGTFADAPALRKEIMERTYFIQRDLFDELNVAQAERVELANMQKRLTDMNLSLEESTVQALAATFEYVRAGGK